MSDPVDPTNMELPIKFEPSGLTVYVLAGSELLEAAALAALAVQTPCGGQGTCGKCRVQFRTPPPAPKPADREHLSAAQLADGWRLACQHTLDAPATLYVPPESVYGRAEQILTSGEQAAFEIRPAVRRRTVRLEPPTLADPRPACTRLRDALGEPDSKIPLDLARRLDTLLADGRQTVTATMANGRIVELAAGDQPAAPLGAAFDIGTTTLVGTLMDLSNGQERAVAARVNPQVAFGDDVVSRIQFCRDDAAGLGELHAAVLRAVDEMLDELAAAAGADRNEIFEIAFAGNTTMQLLLAGVSPASLGAIPFAPAFANALMLEAAELGVAIHPRGRAYVFPAVGGFLGGDTVAGVLAAGLPDRGGAALLIDIGTNGEIVLARDGKLWAASTAAGPAFEGARIGQGMRAAPGAIEKVVIPADGPDLQVNVIGNVPAVGLCGTALIDAAAGLLARGIVEPTGRLRPREELADLPEPLRARVEGAGPKGRFVLAPAVAVTQKDIRELQLASGAIRAGWAILLERAGLAAADLEAVFLAGAFGNYVRRENARRIGLLPDVDIARIHFVGNASSMGARLALMSTDARRRAEQVACSIERVNLSEDLDFQMKFADAMIFPGG